MKKFIKFLFKGLINNEEVINESRHHPWWAALIVGLISVIIAIVPAAVSILNIKGSEILTSSENRSLDTSLVLVSQQLKDENINIVIDEEGKIDVDTIIEQKGNVTTSNSEKIAYQYPVIANNKEILVFTVCTEETVTNFMKSYSEGKLLESDPVAETPKNYLIVTEDNVYITLYSSKNVLDEETSSVIIEPAKAGTSFVGYNSSAKGTNVSSFYATNDPDVCVKNWKGFLQDLYQDQKITTLFITIGISAGVNIVIVALVSLLVMFLTRLKSSTGRKLNYLEALQIIAFSSLAPSVVSIILGFIVPMFAQMSVGFVLCMGLRSTFIGMKAANPKKAESK